jgi:protein required for attachment to host cells
MVLGGGFLMDNLKIDGGEWVVVCDGARALVLENVGDRKYPDLRTKEVYKHEAPATRAIGTDKPGRAFSSSGARRSAVQQTDWHDQEEQHFLAGLAARLDKAVLGGETKALIVVAPARALGVLRKEFSQNVTRAMRAEIEKDYVKMPVDEIAKHLLG